MLSALAVSAVFAAAGCSSRGYETGEAAAESARSTKASISTFAEKTQSALGSMGTLFTSPYQDLAARYETFRKDVDALDTATKSMSSSIASLRKSVDARFKAWDSENMSFQSGDVRTHSQERREEVFRQWQKAQEPLDAGLNRATAMNAQFVDLKKLLGNDLTPKGVESAENLAASARTEAEKVQEATKSWTERLDEAIEALSTGPTTATTGK
jgi:gas vesicle protein